MCGIRSAFIGMQMLAQTTGSTEQIRRLNYSGLDQRNKSKGRARLRQAGNINYRGLNRCGLPACPARRALRSSSSSSSSPARPHGPLEGSRRGPLESAADSVEITAPNAASVGPFARLTGAATCRRLRLIGRSLVSGPPAGERPFETRRNKMSNTTGWWGATVLVATKRPSYRSHLSL